MKCPNYIKLKRISLLYDNYAFVDSAAYLADGIFLNQDLNSVIFKHEFRKEDSLYCIVFCKVRKKDRKKFQICMRKLADKMLIMGYRDYPEFCRNFAKNISTENDAMQTVEQI